MVVTLIRLKLYHSINALFKLLSHAKILPRRAKGLHVEDTARRSNDRHSKIGNGESRQSDSNRRPADYKSAALPAELYRPRKVTSVTTLKRKGQKAIVTFATLQSLGRPYRLIRGRGSTLKAAPPFPNF